MEWEFLTDEISRDALLLDCRSEEAFAAGTISGAVCAGAIKKPYGSGPKSAAALSVFIEGIRSLAQKKTSILCFDEGQGMYAARMAWLLRSAGLKPVKILATRFASLPKEALGPPAPPLELAESAPPFESSALVGLAYVQKNLTRVQLLDVRTPEEYDGLIPRMVNPDPGGICGRIPGSMNWDWRSLYAPDGNLKSRQLVTADIRRIGLIQERPTIIYDFNGARSCGTALVLMASGYRQVSVYLGSWMEWRKSSLPKQNAGVWRP